MRLALTTLSLVLLALPVATADSSMSPLEVEATVAQAYYCEEPKTVSIGAQSASTPRVCVPAP